MWNVQVILTTSMLPVPKTTKLMCNVHVRLTTSMIPHYQNDENNVQGTRTFNNINDIQNHTNVTKIMCQVKVSLTRSMIPHYLSDGNNLEGQINFHHINDAPLPKRRK